MNETAPAAVIGLGGFASVPVVLAAWRRKVPIVLLEQNAILGRANRILLPLADRICLSFANTPVPARSHAKARTTGTPLRRGILPSPAGDLIKRKCLLILGGSQGASGVNEALIQAWPGLRTELAGWRIVHQTGRRDFETIKAGYTRLGIPAEVSPFLTDLGSIYPQTALAISRAGGTSLAELAVHGIPSLLVPYPRSIRDHQLRNAEQFAEAGGAMIVEEGDNPRLTASRLADPLRQLLTRDDLRDTMGQALSSLAFPDAAGKVADLVLADCRMKKRAA